MAFPMLILLSESVFSRELWDLASRASPFSGAGIVIPGDKGLWWCSNCQRPLIHAFPAESAGEERGAAWAEGGALGTRVPL